MKGIIILCLLIFSYSNAAYSYPESQMKDCITSALSNPATKGIPKESLTNYCDCALTAIIDEDKSIRESGYECAKNNFN